MPEKQRRGLLFENVIGYDVPVSLGVIGASREVVGIAMGCEPSEIYETWVRAVERPIPPVEVSRSSTPVKDVVITGHDVGC